MNKLEIDVMSRAEMDRRLRAGEIPGGSAIISISTPEVSYRPLPFHLCDKCVVLEEQFDDVDTKRNDLIPMSAEDAARVVNFVNAIKENRYSFIATPVSREAPVSLPPSRSL